MGCAGNVARMVVLRGLCRVKPVGRGHWGNLGVNGLIILGWISRRWDVVDGLDWASSE